MFLSGSFNGVLAEDDGYIMTTGIPDITFFLKNKHIPSTMGKFALGRIVDCLIERVNEGSRTVLLRTHHKSVREALTFGGKLSFNNLLPGQLMNIVVDKVVKVR